jgi:nucleotide-binding universal stress UspA family protein
MGGCGVFTTILVGTDGSASAETAVARAAELSKLCGARLHPVSAYHPVSVHKLQAERAALPEELGWALHDRQEVDVILHRASKIAEEIGCEVEVHARSEEPVDAILEVAKQESIDLIVVGNRGMQRRLLGSVPNSVAHRADCAVLILDTTQ